jgi:hypothetical protein
LVNYTSEANGWGRVNLLEMEKEDYLSGRFFSLIPLQREVSELNVIGRYEKEANILSDGPKIPLVAKRYTVVNDTLYYLHASEPKVWASTISLDDPYAFSVYDFELNYPINRLFIPAEEKNNIHDVGQAMDDNYRVLGLYYDDLTSTFVMPYFRALFEWEKEHYLKSGGKSQLELGFERYQVAIFTKDFQKIRELTLPLDIHTVIGVSNGSIYLTGFEEGDDYDIIYKTSILP